jgi:flavin-binding protein dodecin
MADQEGKVYRKTELVGTSLVGFEDAIQRAVERARKTLRNVQWFEITEQRGRITDNGAIEYQITLEVGFLLEERP